MNWTDTPPGDLTGGAITFGNFDGIHLGHRALLEAAVRRAKDVGGPAVAVSFDPPSYQVLFPQASPRPPLTTLEDRAALVESLGIRKLVMLRTAPELLALTPEAFFERMILGGFRAKAVLEGANFRFGCNRVGNTSTLRSLCSAAEIRFEELLPIELQREAVSSSRVRAALAAGHVELAAKLLGRPYALAGTVVHGAHRGRTIGFPTANLDDVTTVIPHTGVYAVRAEVNGAVWPAAANIGPNPTFGDDARKIEVHLIGFTGDVYGSAMRIEFVARLRDTRPFASAADLAEQLKQDVAAATAILEAQP
jgi:riboflavin kinase/FMN adenylyltransferase